MSPDPDLMGRFTAYLRTVRGLSEHTVHYYSVDVRIFAEWFQPFNRPIEQTERADVVRYLSDVMERKVSGGRTAQRRLASLRQFFRFLREEEVVEKDPTRDIPVPKTWKVIPKSITADEVDQMVKSLGSTLLDLRNKALLLMLFGSGLRIGEAQAMRGEDLTLDGPTPHAKIWDGKGGKDGVVPLSPQAVEAIRDYLNARQAKTRNLFVSEEGEPLTRMALFKVVRGIAKDALGKKVSPHMLRHGFATSLIEGGADIRDVQALMRHASVDTTQIYIHTDINYLRRIYYETHPRARAKN